MHVVQTEILEDLIVKVGYYDTIEELDKAAGKTGEALRLSNLYMGQKGALVEARSWLFDEVKKATGFLEDQSKNKTVETKDKAGKVTGTKVVNSETEGQYLKRLIASFSSVTAKDHTIKVGDKDHVIKGHATFTDAAHLQKWVQSLLDAHGAFNNDASAPEKKSGPKTPPDYALKAADKVLLGKSPEVLEATIAKWKADFTKRGITFAAFDTADLAANKVAFAWAAHAREEQRKIESADKEYK